MIPQPRKSKKAKRASAPSNTLAKDIKKASAPCSTLATIPSNNTTNNNTNSNTNSNKNNNDDLLNLFDFDNNNNNTNTNANTSNTNTNATANATDDFFDLFADNNNASTSGGTTNKQQKPRNTVNTLQIHPNLANPRESRSLQPDALFDPSMWKSFAENTQQQENQNTEASNGNAANANARNSTLKFEPLNAVKEKEKEEEKDKVRSSKKVSKKPRASAPPTTISSALKLKNRQKPKQKEKDNEEKAEAASSKPKETNALVELHRGAALLKYPRRSGFPHFKHIQLSQDNLRIEWFSKRKNLDQTCIWIKDVREVVRGQETEVFKKFHQKTLEKSSFSVVYGHSYKTLDVAAKSIDECEMWVKSILKLVDIYKAKQNENDLAKLRELYVGIHFKDRNRPMSREGSGNFIRANSSKNLKIDPVALKEIERDMEALHKSYFKTSSMAQKPIITKSNQYSNIQYVLSELEERIEELTYEVANIRDTELAKREVWRANVDLSAIQEKVEVLLKHLNSKTDRRKSNFL